MSTTVQETSPNSTSPSTDLVSYPAPVYTWPAGEKPSVRKAYDAKQGAK